MDEIWRDFLRAMRAAVPLRHALPREAESFVAELLHAGFSKDQVLELARDACTALAKGDGLDAGKCAAAVWIHLTEQR